jgi:flavin reductase (DIM6/NTAB) family NADH-FMN oxidoreductase RutF
METRDIPYTQNLDDTLARLANGGLLLTSAAPDGPPNVMTIGWGTPGVIWGRPIFTILVRPSRYTFGLIEQSRDFVVCVPDDGMEEALALCGTASGRDVDKFADQNLTAVAAETVSAPLIAECRRFYECRVVHYNDLSDAALDAEVRSACYPNGDLHRLYYGQILRACEQT